MERKDWSECYRCRALYVDFIDPDCEVCEGTGLQCPNCAGAGYVRNDADKVVACRCGITSRRLAKALGSVSALRGRLLTYTLDNFNRNWPGVTAAWNAVCNWLKMLQAGGQAGWLTVWSQTKGNGKTHLAAGAAMKLNEAGRVAVLINAPDFLDYLKETFRPGAPESTATRLQRVRECDVLIIDDLGVEYSKYNGAGTSWAEEQFYKLLDYRLRMDLPVMVTTNVPPSHMEERIASRLRRNGVVVKITAKEYTR